MGKNKCPASQTDLTSVKSALPLVSVIVPAFNAYNTLGRCVSSVLAQSYSNLEVIVIDDGSTDGTASICRDLASRNDNVKAEHKSNGGLSSARNAGIELANGSYILFLDSDDYLDANAIEELYRGAVHGEADMVIGTIEYVDPDGNEIQVLNHPPAVLSEREFWEDAFPRVGGGSNVQHIISAGKLMKATLFDGERFDEGKIHEDEFIIHRLVAQCDRIAFIVGGRYYYVQHSNSITHQASDKAQLDAVEGLLLRAKYLAERRWWAPAVRTLAYAKGLIVASGKTSADDPMMKDRIIALIQEWRRVFAVTKFIGNSGARTMIACSLFNCMPNVFLDERFIVGVGRKGYWR